MSFFINAGAAIVTIILVAFFKYKLSISRNWSNIILFAIFCLLFIVIIIPISSTIQQLIMCILYSVISSLGTPIEKLFVYLKKHTSRVRNHHDK